MSRTVIIHWQMSWSGQFSDYNWTGEFEDDGDVYDYNTKESLKTDCIKDGFNYKVIRHHKDGTDTIMEEYNQNN